MLGKEAHGGERRPKERDEVVADRPRDSFGERLGDLEGEPGALDLEVASTSIRSKRLCQG